MTPRLAALELQTQTTNVAVCPAFTSDELLKDWIRAHSCATACFFFFGFGEELGVGDGFGFEVLLGDGLAVGLGLEVAFFVDVLGEGVGLGDELDDVPDDVLADVLGEGEVLVDLAGVALAVADAARPSAGTVLSVSDARSTEFLGTDAQTEWTIGWDT
jgi:hypothetical protein